MRNNALAGKIGLDRPQKLVENRVSFAGPHSELSIYDTYLPVEKVLLHSSGLLYCGMIQGKKVLHSAHPVIGGAESMDFVPNQSFVMAPSSSVAIDFPEAKIDTPTRCLTVEISPERIAMITDRLDQQLGAPLTLDSWRVLSGNHLHTQHSQGTQLLLERLFNSFVEDDSERDIAIDFGVSELVTRIFKHQARDFLLSDSQENSDKNGLQASIHHIKTHLAEPLDIDCLCKIACMSRSRFYRAFKQKVGCSPLNLQQYLRVETAAKLLRTGSSVSDVCFSLGFANLSHFNRRFQEQYGMAPSAFSRGQASH
ncbi:helix-turn-helix domain-containing protein [uncultured Paraglaciecola sp.]|uniref:helix-turn-helix domain-containing protein n=1 Tax=uncultured Paraglaciecola sp. TaxID=1765024 RepID=UPI0030D8FEF1|tara:strand:- start:194648 stop:195580 length:933 start_codon:yes stop_codon:yes gene_type:complete